MQSELKLPLSLPCLANNGKGYLLSKELDAATDLLYCRSKELSCRTTLPPNVQEKEAVIWMGCSPVVREKQVTAVRQRRSMARWVMAKMDWHSLTHC
ncbi:hypothetical protein ACLOJK_023213 [Asimina triloba]